MKQNSGVGARVCKGYRQRCNYVVIFLLFRNTYGQLRLPHEGRVPGTCRGKAKIKFDGECAVYG